MPALRGRPERVMAALSREDWAALCTRMGLPEGTALRWRAVEDLASDGLMLVVDQADPGDGGDGGAAGEWHALLTGRELSWPAADVWPLILARLKPIVRTGPGDARPLAPPEGVG